MFGVDERRERGLGGVVPLAGCRLTTDVLRGTDDFEVLVLQLEIQFLPAWQIESAPSPGSPGDEQHFLATKIREMDRPPLAIADGEIGCHARGEKSAPDCLHFAEAPDPSVTIGDDRLTDLPRKRSQIEIVATHHVAREGNAQIVATRALRLDLERVDLWQVALVNPQGVWRSRVRKPALHHGRTLVVQNRGRGICSRGRCTAGDSRGHERRHTRQSQEIPSQHSRNP
jgi:hypothetical protein